MFRSTVAYITAVLSWVLGAGSLLGFMAFLYAGPFNLVNLRLEEHQILLFDAGLSVLFFSQHSIMIRKSFRRLMGCFVPEAYSGAFYSISSGAVLAAVIILWQGSETMIASAEGTFRIVLRAAFFLSMAGFFRVFRSMKHFDALGVKRIRDSLKGRQPREVPFVVEGPYRMVRHPLYFLTLAAIWVYPYLTADRLILNVLWTAWIVIGTVLEERDLIKEFGEKYLDYRREVPMLIPFKLPRAR